MSLKDFDPLVFHLLAEFGSLWGIALFPGNEELDAKEVQEEGSQTKDSLKIGNVMGIGSTFNAGSPLLWVLHFYCNVAITKMLSTCPCSLFHVVCSLIFAVFGHITAGALYV